MRKYKGRPHVVRQPSRLFNRTRLKAHRSKLEDAQLREERRIAALAQKCSLGTRVRYLGREWFVKGTPEIEHKSVFVPPAGKEVAVDASLLEFLD